MDISATTEPKSDQQNFDDYIGGPKTVTISEVKKGNTEQPVEVHLVEFPGRPFKPGKSMRRVMVAVWGPNSATYAGRRLRLYGDPTVKFGGQEVGGIRISHMSDIDEPQSVNLTISKGKRAPFVVHPLVSVDDAIAWIADAADMGALQSAWKRVQVEGMTTVPGLVEAKDARKAVLSEPGS